MIDLALRGATVVDGTGDEGRVADVGIVGDQVVALGDVGAAHRSVDVEGLVLAPGFVDPHSHTDFTLLANRNAESTIRQGVTTEVVGNCGLGFAPLSDESESEALARLSSKGYEAESLPWRSFSDYLAAVESGGTSQNLTFFVGHSTVRAAAGVRGSEFDELGIGVMRRLVEEAMEAGALGLSSGLEYDLGAVAPSEELHELARVVARHGGMYASHVRNRDEHIHAAIDEFLGVVRAGNIPGQISHLNVRHDSCAPANAWRDAVEMMCAARLEGFDVQADTTPFPQGLGRMDGLLPGWVYEDGVTGALQILRSDDGRRRVRGDLDRYWRFLNKGQWHRARMQNSLAFPELNGKTFAEIAAIRDQEPVDAYLDMLVAAGEGMRSMSMVGDLFTDEHLAEMITHPLFSLGIDAYSSTATGPLSRMTPSPLPFSGHTYYLTEHVRARGTLSLEEAIRKMTGMPATRFGLRRRGLVREGYFADIVLFDFERLESRSTFANPWAYPVGVEMVLVNGVPVVERGEHLGTRPGRVLRRDGSGR